MSLNFPMLLEMNHEMAGLRRTMERVPVDQLDWQPHAKSMTMRALITHLAGIPKWGAVTIESAEFDVAPGGEPMEEKPVASLEEALDLFDENVKAFGLALKGANDAVLMAPWSLKSHGETLFEMPRLGALRGMIMNHMIHHRAQLTVYLRMHDVPVPGLFGPTADEPV